ncbi:Uncharacterised protein [Mycobacteroides abscessus subsp. abscessus]|nr:Uncharacterised protein [Mycobacteroides abscessus subsp. abscessus]
MPATAIASIMSSVTAANMAGRSRRANASRMAAACLAKPLTSSTCS